jgi:hypothetical protein
MLLIVDDQRRRPMSPWSNAVRSDNDLEDAWRAEVLTGASEFLPPGAQPDIFRIFPNEAMSPNIAVPYDFLETISECQTVIWDCATGDDCGVRRSSSRMTS